jgi:hypothetical protein
MSSAAPLIKGGAMRQFIIASAMAAGLIAIWAAMLPLAAQPAAPPPALSKALSLCRGPNGIDRACTVALAQALLSGEPDTSAAHVGDQYCRADPQLLASLSRHG